MVAQRISIRRRDADRSATADTGPAVPASSRLHRLVCCGIVWLVAVVGCSRAPQTPTEQAQQLMRTADFAGAAVKWEEVLQADPSVVEAWVGLGQCRFAQDDYHGAVDAYSSAIKIEPDNGQLFLYRSDAYDKLNDHDAASADWKRGTQLHPDGWARLSPDAGVPDSSASTTTPDADSSTGSAGMTLPPAVPNLAGSSTPGSSPPGSVKPGVMPPGVIPPGMGPTSPGQPQLGRTESVRSTEPGGRGSNGSPTTPPSRLQPPLATGRDRAQAADRGGPGSPPAQNPLAALAAGEKVTGPPSRGATTRPGDLEAEADEAEESESEDEEVPKAKPKPKSKPKSADQRRRYVVPASPWGSPWQPPDQYGPWGIPMWNSTPEANSAGPSSGFGSSNWGAGTGLSAPTGVTGRAYADTWNSPAGTHGFAGSGNAMVNQTPRQAEGGLPAPDVGSPWRAPMVRPHSGVMLMDDARLNLDANLGVGPGTGIYQPRYNFNRPSWKEQPLPRPYGFERSIVPVPR